MILNYEQIKQKAILTDTVESGYNNAVYDIRVGKIVTIKGDEQDEYEIPPQGMIVVISREHVTVPVDIVGYAHVRTGLSSKGIMAINIGVIDPGYTGKLASTLLNFGKEPFKMKVGDTFLRTTFHPLQRVDTDMSLVVQKEKSMNDVNYLITKKFEASKYMDETFMSFDKEVRKSIRNVLNDIIKYAGGFSASLALATFCINFIVNKCTKDPTEEYKYELRINQLKYNELDKEYNLLQRRIDSVTKLLPVEPNRPVAGTVITSATSSTPIRESKP